MESKHSNTILTGDALAVLKTMPDSFVQTCITSPPYLWLRDYGVPGQIGLEATPAEFVSKLVEVFREVRRVLRDDGTLWLNLGDTYANDTKWGGSTGGKHVEELHGDNATRRRRSTGLPAKSLMGIPWRVAFALQDDGWVLRSDIIWAKGNPMPESCTDRPTRSHEYIFLFAKSERYFYDHTAIREPLRDTTIAREQYGYRHAFANQFKGSPVDKRHVNGKELADVSSSVGRNKRSVWHVNFAPYEEAHFATFPPKLIEPMILSGSSPRACEYCGAPWERLVEHEFIPQQDIRDPAKLAKGSIKGLDASNGWGNMPRGTTITTTAGWQPTCPCPDNTGEAHCIVLDPFAGAGTTLLVASQLQRNWLGIELNPEYVNLAWKRIQTVQPNMWEGMI